jgi:hypothetical protein
VRTPMQPATYLVPLPTSSNEISSNHSSASARAKTITRPSTSFGPSAPPFKADDNTAQSPIYPPPSSPWSQPMSGPPISSCNMSDMTTATAWVKSDWGGAGERLPLTSMATPNSHYHAGTPWPQELLSQSYPPQWEGPFPSSYPPFSLPPPDSVSADAWGGNPFLGTHARAGEAFFNLTNDGAEDYSIREPSDPSSF